MRPTLQVIELGGTEPTVQGYCSSAELGSCTLAVVAASIGVLGTPCIYTARCVCSIVDMMWQGDLQVWHGLSLAGKGCGLDAAVYAGFVKPDRSICLQQLNACCPAVYGDFRPVVRSRRAEHAKLILECSFEASL